MRWLSPERKVLQIAAVPRGSCGEAGADRDRRYGFVWDSRSQQECDCYHQAEGVRSYRERGKWYMQSLEERCLSLLSSTRGKFHTTASMSETLQVPAEPLRQALADLYLTCRIDRLVLVEGDRMTGFYGWRIGVEPGTAFINNMKGHAA